MLIELKLRDSARVALAIAAAFPLGVQAAGAGRIDYVSGTVSALAPDGRSRALTKGAEINPGETIDTGSGRAQVRFSDGAQVSLQPRSQFRVDDYKFAGKVDGSETGFFSLLKGGMRTITGLIGSGNRQNYKVTTNVATIGIRGTEFVISYSNGSITISTGEGVVEVCNAAGCLILNSGDSAVVVDNATSPVRTEIRATTTTDTTTPSVRIDYTKADEGLSAVLPKAAPLVSGPGYAMAMVGIDGAEGFVTGVGGSTINFAAEPSGTATFDASSQLAAFAGTKTYQSTTIAGGFTDGTIGWGRWTSGTLTPGASLPSETLSGSHYIVGKPTSSADFTGSLANMEGSYTLTGYTLPTAFTQYSNGPTTVGSSGITGSFSARFTEGDVNLTLNNISVAGQTYGIATGWVSGFNDSAAISVSNRGAAVNGNITLSSLQGYFIGANAARVGLVYQFTDGQTISGATVFSLTGLTSYVAPPPPQ